MDKDSKIYVAGHTGLLGSALVRRLRYRGYNNLITIAHEDLDLTDQREVDAFFRLNRPEYVFLAAGRTGGIWANSRYPVDFLHENTSIQNNIFESANRYEVRHLVFYGSSCVYPRDATQPIREDSLLSGRIEETSEAYAIAKIAGIIACRAYNSQYKAKRFIALIPNSMYGPNDNFEPDSSHVLSALIRKIHDAKLKDEEKVVLWGSGEPRREFIFVDDVADASIFAVENAERLENRHYNIGTGTDYSIKELACMVSDVVGFKGRIEWDTTKPEGAPKKLLDSSRFMNLGWKPIYDFKETLKYTYKWFLRYHPCQDKIAI